MNVLILHHERLIADTVADILYQHGLNALPVYRDIDAWREVRAFVFEVAIVSTEMPGWTGIELGDWLWDACDREGRWLSIVRIGSEDAGRFEPTDFHEKVLRRLVMPCLALPCEVGDLLARVQESFEDWQRWDRMRAYRRTVWDGVEEGEQCDSA
jgi:hypothetical protein